MEGWPPECLLHLRERTWKQPAWAHTPHGVVRPKAACPLTGGRQVEADAIAGAAPRRLRPEADSPRGGVRWAGWRDRRNTTLVRVGTSRGRALLVPDSPAVASWADPARRPWPERPQGVQALGGHSCAAHGSPSGGRPIPGTRARRQWAVFRPGDGRAQGPRHAGRKRRQQSGCHGALATKCDPLLEARELRRPKSGVRTLSSRREKALWMMLAVTCGAASVFGAGGRGRMRRGLAYRGAARGQPRPRDVAAPAVAISRRRSGSPPRTAGAPRRRAYSCGGYRPATAAPAALTLALR